jgi:hypothetical protein
MHGPTQDAVTAAQAHFQAADLTRMRRMIEARARFLAACQAVFEGEKETQLAANQLVALVYGEDPQPDKTNDSWRWRQVATRPYELSSGLIGDDGYFVFDDPTDSGRMDFSPRIEPVFTVCIKSADPALSGEYQMRLYALNYKTSKGVLYWSAPGHHTEVRRHIGISVDLGQGPDQEVYLSVYEADSHCTVTGPIVDLVGGG